MTTNNNNQRGIALVAALFWASALLFLGTTFCLISVVESRIVHNEVSGERAFQLAEAGIDHVKRALISENLTAILNGTAGYGSAGTPPFGPSVNMAGGTYTVVVTNNIGATGFPRGAVPADPSASATVDSDGIVVLTATGDYHDGQQVIEAVVDTNPFPSFNAALHQVSDGGDAELRVEDAAWINGNEESGTCANAPGVIWAASSMDLDAGAISGAPSVRPFSDPPDDPFLGDAAALIALMNEWLALPGVVTVGGNPPATLGTAANPQITHLVGSGDIKDSPFTGYGILIVTGELEIRNDFSFYGLVLIWSCDRVRIRDASNQGFHGSVVVVCDSDETEVRIEDQTLIQYNCADVKNYAQAVIGPGIERLSWRQVY